MTPGAFYEIVLDLCMEHEASMTSAFRTRKRNAAVGGMPRSRHLEGLAFDCVPDENTRVNRQALLRAAQTVGLGAEDEDDHVHIQVRREPRRSI